MRFCIPNDTVLEPAAVAGDNLSRVPASTMLTGVIARMAWLSLLMSVWLFCQGCVVWRYTTSPPVSGVVRDSATGSPVVNAKVGFREHERIQTLTAADGSFRLPLGHTWGPALIIPFEFTPCGGTFFIEAPGYEAFELVIGPRMYHPVVFQEPVILWRKTHY